MNPYQPTFGEPTPHVLTGAPPDGLCLVCDECDGCEGHTGPHDCGHDIDQAAARLVVTAALRHYQDDSAFRAHVDHVVAVILAANPHGFEYNVRRGATVATHLTWDGGDQR